MAVIGSSFVNIIDQLKMLGPDGAAELNAVQLLKQYNPIYADAISVEANMGLRHRTTMETGLPSVTWGKLYQGIPQSKSQRQQVEDTTGFVEGLSTIDERLLEISSDPAATRMIEGQGFVEAFAQEIATGILYHDTSTTPEKFKGLFARYNAIAGAPAGSGNNVISAGGAGSDNTSIVFVTWGDNYTHLIHPKGTISGLNRQDMGRQRVTDSTGAYYVQEEQFRQHIGLTVRDWRANFRIANIDVSDMAAGSVDLYKFLRQGYWRVKKVMRTDPNPGLGIAGSRQVIYCNASVLEALDATQTNSNNTALRLMPMELEGQEVLSYRGIPIRQLDALLNTETVVS